MAFLFWHNGELNLLNNTVVEWRRTATEEKETYKWHYQEVF